jgi:hypothetical protein
MQNIPITDKVKKLILLGKTRSEIYSSLDISKNTFKVRMHKHNWKKPEIEMINRM